MSAASPDKPIARWLRETRLRQTMGDGDDRPWTVGYFLERILEETRWAPQRPNYSAYENGRATPNRDTLAKFMAFWAARGQPGPNLTPPAPAPTESETLIAALTAQTAALTAQAAAINGLVKEMRLARAGQEGRLEGIERGLSVVASIREAGASEVSNGPPSPAGTGR
jgi:hypothetical protein